MYNHLLAKCTSIRTYVRKEFLSQTTLKKWKCVVKTGGEVNTGDMIVNGAVTTTWKMMQTSQTCSHWSEQ